MENLYTGCCCNREILEKAATALADIYRDVPELSLKGRVISVDAELLSHAYELLLAFAYTYEHYRLTDTTPCQPCCELH